MKHKQSNISKPNKNNDRVRARLPLVQGASRKVLKNDVNNPGGGGRVCTDDGSDEVCEVFANISERQQQEKQSEVREQLDSINLRVKQALAHCGHDNVASGAREQGPVYDISETREKQLKQQNLLQLMDQFTAASKQNNKLISEVGEWLEWSAADTSNKDLVMTEDMLNQQLQAIELLDKSMREALDFAQSAGEKLNVVGCRLIEAAGLADANGLGRFRAAVEQVKLINRTIHFDVDMMLDSDENHDLAFTELQTILEQALLMVPNKQQKTFIRAGLKQHLSIKGASDIIRKKLADAQKEITLKDKKVKELSTQVMKGEERFGMKNKEISVLRSNVTAFEKESSRRKEENEKLQNELARVEEQLELAEAAALAAAGSSRRLRPRDSLTGETSSSLLCTVPGGAAMLSLPSRQQLTQTQEHLEAQLEQLTTANRNLEEQLAAERVRTGELSAQLESACQSGGGEGNLDGDDDGGSESTSSSLIKVHVKTELNEKAKLLELLSELRGECEHKDRLLATQERRISDLEYAQQQREDGEASDVCQSQGEKSCETSDSAYDSDSQNQITKVTTTLNANISALKADLESEKARGEATLRQLATAHKDQLEAYHTQNLQLTHAINRFKESLAKALERDELGEAAGDVRAQPDLCVDESATALSRVAGPAVELLAQLEYKVAQALGERRAARQQRQDGLAAQAQRAAAARAQAELAAAQLREARHHANSDKQARRRHATQDNARHAALATRFESVSQQYTQMQREMAALQQAYLDAMKEKERRVTASQAAGRSLAGCLEQCRVALRRMHTHLARRRQRHATDLQISLQDQARNLERLTALLAGGHLSTPMQRATAELVAKLDQLRDLRLGQLLARYIRFRRMHAVQEHVRRKAEQTDAASTGSVQSFISVTNSRMVENTDKLHQEWEVLEKERQKIFVAMKEIVLQVNADSEMLLLGQRALDAAASSGGRGGGASEPRPTAAGPRMLADAPARQLDPAGVRGRTVTSNAPATLWTLPTLATPVPGCGVTTPRLLDMDVNQRAVAARRVLQRLTPAPAEGVDYQERVLRSLRELMQHGGGPDPTPPQRATSPCLLAD